ncbi:MAG TPA: histidinol-phosphate transaminase [Actinomycetales bacterium]|nr:histidinol-phosphate transaminase [Actinomycetales bacterium]
MTGLDDLPLREDLRGRAPYGAPQLEVAVRLNTNENSYDVPPDVVTAVVDALSREVPHLNRYPDREFAALRADLAAYLGHGLTPEQVWAANGSNEVLQQLLQAFGGSGRVALGFTPAYSMHPIIANATGTAWVDGQRDSDFDLDAGHVAAQVADVDPDVVFLCSPNNPTGTALRRDVVIAACEAARGMVVVDEAYAEFAREGAVSALSVLPDRPRLVVTRTMSKAFTFAGARLGYLAAAPAVCDALRLVRLPYHLSSLTQAAARAALAHAGALLSTVDAIKMQRDRIVDALPRLGLHPVPSDANFVLFGGLDDEKRTWQDLLDRGVLVRDVGIRHHLRVTAGTPDETTAFLDALADTRGATS